ncbi:MAG: MMPL family transporter [Syntrophobacteraceae bacterium]|nr:MMPL family transporter [Syntrophobacteraceae bacterium]
MKHPNHDEIQPVIRDLSEFDDRSGSIVERILFNHRGVVLALSVIVTIVLGYNALHLRLNASFEKTIPTGHPFIKTYLRHKGDLRALGTAVRIAVENTRGTIYSKDYLDTLHKLSDAVFLMPGVDRSFMRSLWSAGTRWIAVTEDGYEGGPVIPSHYDGSAKSLEEVRQDVERSNEIGHLVALNQGSSIIYAPLLSTYSNGKPFDYGKFSESLEALRHKYQSDAIRIHITGFAKVEGDLIEGVRQILIFFGFAFLISVAMIYWFTRCIRSTLVVATCSLTAVIWQLGLTAGLGYQLDPYSVLVPFLVFAIAMSHGAQKMNGIMQDIGRGTHKQIAARYTFRRLFLAGLTALLADTVGFAVLMIIDIEVIRELALIASIGVAVIIFTNLILVPVLLSYAGVTPEAALRSLKAEEAGRSGEAPHLLWRVLDLFTKRKWASVAIVFSIVLAIGGYDTGRGLKIGDLNPGAPELRPDSRYNRDNAFMQAHYGASSDVLAVLVETPPGMCSLYDTIMRLDALEWRLRQLKAVDSTNSLALLCREASIGLNEGCLKWYDVPHSQVMINGITANAPRGLYNDSCDLLTLYVYLTDHKASTLTNVVNTVESFAPNNDTKNAKFLLGAGSAGIEAATNIVVEKANREMLFIVYGAVILLCFITFRSWRGVLCAVLPLMLTSTLAEALMVCFKIGVKVSTLPVIALGVGIGVDYALYLLSVMLGHLRAGRTLSDAYYRSLLFTGRVVILVGVTLAAAVATWAFSPIKFQADMGIMLAFMFLWNMLGTLTLLPSLARFLLPQRAISMKADGKKATVNDRLAVGNGFQRTG